MGAKQHTNFMTTRPVVTEIQKGDTSARAHVQMYHTHGLSNMHRYLPVNTLMICSRSAQPLLSYSLAANFDILHAARATCTSQIWL